MQKMTQVEFFKVCDFMRSNSERLRSMDGTDMLHLVEKETGAMVTRHHFRRIQEATGIDWLVNDRKRREIRQSEAVRILACSVATLFRDHEREIPSDLATLAAEGFALEGGSGE